MKFPNNLKFLFILLSIFPRHSYSISTEDVMNELEPEAIKMAKDMISKSADFAASCAPYSPQSIADLVDTWREIVQNMTTTVAQAASELAFSPSYPTICSVYTNNIAAQYDDSGKSIWNVKSPSYSFWNYSPLRIDAETLNPTYYWPKYFIEASEKGNDAFSAFASNNAFYMANRKVASSISSLVDQAGAVKLTAMATGASFAFDTAMSATGLPMKLGGADVSKLSQTTVLTPLEAMRVRASKSPTNPTYDANIWPVAWSHIAGRMSVCHGYTNDQIGYVWKGGQYGAPDTCPVAMAKDAFAYWDTGMLDYVNPAAVSGMIAASNPYSCGASAAVSALANMDAVQSSPLGDRGPINQSIQGLDPSLAGISGCSFPILGDAIQIAKAAVGSVTRFGGPWCSIWGSVAPRSSTVVQDSDYSFALTAQKFELLSQELFGVPRAKKERWTLAYPWEGEISLGGNPNPGNLNPSDVISSGIGKIVSKIPGGDKLASSPVSRSDTLMFPGDPRLIDTSLSPKYYADRAANFLAEGAYIAGGMAAGPAAWTATELARLKYDDFRGQNTFTGNKRIYTIWENVSCKASFAKVTSSMFGKKLLTQYWSLNPNGSLGSPSCKAFVRFEFYKLFQTKLLRKTCDMLSKAKILPGNQSLGAPFK